MHTGDEMDVLNFVRSFRNQYVSGREICRRAGGRRKFENDPRWAMPIIIGLVVRGFLVADAHGHFCAVTKEDQGAPAASGPAPSGGPGQTIVISAEEERRIDEVIRPKLGGRIPL